MLKFLRVFSAGMTFFLLMIVATCHIMLMWAWCTVMRTPASSVRRRAGRSRAFWTSSLLRIVMWELDIRLDVTALNPERDRLRLGSHVLAVSNHQSSADIVILAKVLADLGYRDTRWIAKRSLRYMGYVGFSMMMDGSALIRRDGNGRDLAEIIACAERARGDRATIVLFPEGTRFSARRKKPGYAHVLPPKRGGLLTLLEHLGPECRVLSLTLHWSGMAEAKNWLGTVMDIVGKNIDVEWEIVDADDDWLEDEWRRKDRLLSALERTA